MYNQIAANSSTTIVQCNRLSSIEYDFFLGFRVIRVIRRVIRAIRGY